MPIYEYECSKCGVIEVMQKITDGQLKKCPECNRKVKRLMSLNNFQLKGTGWYTTDYAQKKGGNGGCPKAKDAKSESKSETKSTTETTKETATPETKKACDSPKCDAGSCPVS